MDYEYEDEGAAGMFIFYVFAIIFNSWLVYQCTLAFSFGTLKSRRKQIKEASKDSVVIVLV